MQDEERRRPAAERAYTKDQATVARTLIKSLGADEAVRCARRQGWDGVLIPVLAEAGGAGAGAAPPRRPYSAGAGRRRP